MTIRPAALDLGEMCRVDHSESGGGIWAAVVSGPDDTRALFVQGGPDAPPMMYLGPDDHPNRIPGAPPASLVLTESRILTLPRESLVPIE
jgi:hypothetical protein